LDKYEGQISSHLVIEARFDSSGSGLIHVDDIKLAEVIVSEDENIMKIFWGKIWEIMWDKEKLFVMFPDHKAVQKMNDFVECFKLFL
jgi:hypothetical protein